MSGDRSRVGLAADRPKERGHLSGNRRNDDGQLLAGCAEPAIPATQPNLRLPGDIADRLWQRFEASSQGLADASGMAVAPSRFDQHSTCSTVACQGQAGAAHCLAASPGAAEESASAAQSRAGLDQQVADPTHRVDLDAGAAIHELASQMMDMNRDGVRAQFIVYAVECLFQHRLRYNPTGTPHQMLQDGALAPRQHQHCLADAHVASDRIESDVAAAQYGSKCA